MTNGEIVPGPPDGPRLPGRQSARDRTIALWLRAAVTILSITALLYVIEAIDSATGHRMDDEGIEPRRASGLVGVLVSPFLHADWNHLISNTVPGVVLGFLVLLAGRFLSVTLVVWFTSGMGVWLFGASGTVTIGASGIIFGWLAFILVRGIFSRVVWQIVLGVIVLITYGGVLWGALPGTPGISWQAHAFGAAGGVLVAWYLGVQERDRRAEGSTKRSITG